MSYAQFDADLYRTVYKTVRHGPDCASGMIAYERRSDEEVAQIKADRLAREEETILRRADEIRARRSAVPKPSSDRMAVGE